MSPNFLIYLVHGNLEVRVCLMFIAMIGMLLLVGLILFSFLKVYGEEQEREQPTVKNVSTKRECDLIEPCMS